MVFRLKIAEEKRLRMARAVVQLMIDSGTPLNTVIRVNRGMYLMWFRKFFSMDIPAEFHTNEVTEKFANLHANDVGKWHSWSEIDQAALALTNFEFATMLQSADAYFCA